LWPGHPKHSQTRPGLAEGHPEGPLVQGIWPLSSKDCNPLDYFMWSEVEREVNKQPHNILSSLNAMISDVMAKLDRDVVIHVCKGFRSCIEADMEATRIFYQINVHGI
jgi:hypothetical protein